MRVLVLTDVALWGALILVAALIIIRRRRSSHSRMPARSLRRDTAELAGQKMSPRKTAIVTGHDEDHGEPDRSAHGQPAQRPTAPPRAADAEAGSRRPGTQRAGRQAPAGTAGPSEQIVSYYDQADQPIADYLAALGWTHKPHTPPGRAAGANADSAAEPRGGKPAP